MSAAQDLTSALGGKWRGTHGEVRCVAHDDRDPSLTIRNGDSKPLLRCHAGCSNDDIIDVLRARGLWPERSSEWQPRRTGFVRKLHQDALPPTAEELRNRAAALRIWGECRDPAGTVVQEYLRGRAIEGQIPTAIAYHPSLRHADTGLAFPTMLAAVVSGDGSALLAVQRTFLRLDGRGKAAVSRPKMTLGSLRDGAVRLAAAGPVLGIAEGVETGLSAMELFDVPIWCSLGAKRLRAIRLPPCVERVVIFGDTGEEGERQAREAADEFARQGRHVEGRFPAAGDWNDELQRRRCAA